MTCNDAPGVCCCAQCHERRKMLPVEVDGDLLGHICCQKRLWLKTTKGGRRVLARFHRAFVAALVDAERTTTRKAARPS